MSSRPEKAHGTRRNKESSGLPEYRTDFFHQGMVAAEMIHEGAAAFPFREGRPAHTTIRLPEHQSFSRGGRERFVWFPLQVLLN